MRDTLVRGDQRVLRRPSSAPFAARSTLLWGAEDRRRARRGRRASGRACIGGSAVPGAERPTVTLEVLEGVGHLVPTDGARGARAGDRGLLA